MESAPLNLAHFHERRSERQLKRNHFDGAIECLEQSIFYIGQAKKTIKVPKALEVIIVLERQYKARIDHIKWRKKHEPIKYKKPEEISMKKSVNSNYNSPLKVSNVKQIEKIEINKLSLSDSKMNKTLYDIDEDIDIEPLELPPLEMPSFNFLNLDIGDDANEYFNDEN